MALVYSTNTSLNQKCPRCKQVLLECRCRADVVVPATGLSPVLRMETSGRGGKTVTVIDQLPKVEKFLKELCTELKKKCGADGTYLISGIHGIIEIQGDKRDFIRGILSNRGMTVRG